MSRAEGSNARDSELFSNLEIRFSRITKKVAAGVHQGVTTVELDNLAAETAAYLTTKHPDYAILAARIAISNLHKETKKIFSEVVHDLYKWGECREGFETRFAKVLGSLCGVFWHIRAC